MRDRECGMSPVNLLDAVSDEMDKVVARASEPMDACVAAVLTASWANGQLQSAGFTLTPSDCLSLWRLSKSVAT